MPSAPGQGQKPQTRFEALLKSEEADIDLIEAALLIAADHNPDLDIDTCRLDIADIASRAKTFFKNSSVSKTTNIEIAATELCNFLKTEEGFCGNADDYYDPNNSYLDQVLHRRKGIPISLALIYIHIAKELGYLAEGIGFPGHFLVKLGIENNNTIIDPFGGIPLSKEDCKKMLNIGTQGKVAFSDKLLEASGNREILQRILQNLKMIYLQRKDFEKGLGLCDWLLLVNPGSTQDIFDRALILEKLNCFSLAADELEQLLAMDRQDSENLLTAPRHSQHELLQKKIEHLRKLDQTPVH